MKWIMGLLNGVSLKPVVYAALVLVLGLCTAIGVQSCQIRKLKGEIKEQLVASGEQGALLRAANATLQLYYQRGEEAKARLRSAAARVAKEREANRAEIDRLAAEPMPAGNVRVMNYLVEKAMKLNAGWENDK